MTPNVDRNKAPETWITAAPQDTVTIRDDLGNPIAPRPATIPSRFHMYWAGSDEDGTVAGFYFAVVETVGAPGLPPPPLPAPKPRDYHFTTQRDSVFIFNVFERTNEREHAFFIYAVDNLGKPDPTPARVIFNALDRLPPIPVITYATAVGRIFDPSNLDAPPFQKSYSLTDTTDPFQPHVRDTVPVNSVLTFRWRADMAVANNPAVAFKYKLDEGTFNSVPASVTEAIYNSGDSDRVGPGRKIFTLLAIDQSGGGGNPETRRRFVMNLSPDTWFAGPELVPASDPLFYTVVRYANGQVKERYRQLTGPFPWRDLDLAFPNGFPGSYLSPDSLRVMPARRRPNKTFFELYSEHDFATNQPRHRIYVHAEGDTVHLNSRVLFYTGGFDPDSPYDVRLSGTHPDLPGIGVEPVLTKGPPNGSPIGFRFRIPVALDPAGLPVSFFPLSPTYPLLDPLEVPEPHIGGYQAVQQSGRAYALIRAEDGHGGLDNRIGNPVAFVDSVEKGWITPASPRYALRDKVLTFYVNRAPYLLLDNPSWQPKQDSTYFQRSIPLTLSLVGDDDPSCPRLPCTVGGPDISNRVFRYTVVLRGRRTGESYETAYAPPQLTRAVTTGIPINTTVDVPDSIAGPRVALDIEICDCADCEIVSGQGRCRKYPPIVVYIPAAPEPPAASSRGDVHSGGPGFSGAASGSKTP